MFRNVFAAALSNLARSPLYGAISIASLAIGLAAAVLTGLFIRDELTFDSFIPGHESLLVARWSFASPGVAPQQHTWSISPLAGWLKLDFPEVADAQRIAPETVASVRRGEVEASETVAWADPGFLRLLPYPALAGDPATALERPDAVVITRSVARKYFGQDRPLGQLLEFKRQRVFRVAAVLQDYPGSANVTAQIFASGRSPMSLLAQADAEPYRTGGFNNMARTFVRLKDPRRLPAVNAAMPAFVERRMLPPAVRALFTPGAVLTYTLVPISLIHLMPDSGAATPTSSPALLAGMGVLAVLVLAVAVANFVNLMTARAARRAVEVGVRKAVGAGRGQLMAQFMGEALLYVAMALVCALALVEFALPGLNALMLRKIAFSYWRDPQLLAFCLGLCALTTLAAGLYPALVLSSFRPSMVLKGGPVRPGGSALVRQGLVAMQFAVLVMMVLGVVVVERQTRFAMDEATGIDKDSLLRITVDAPCRGAFKDAVARLPGVRSVACSSPLAMGTGGEDSRSIVLPDGRTGLADLAPVDFGFLEQLGVRPLAGRLPSAEHPGDEMPVDGRRACIRFGDGEQGVIATPIVVNQALARATGARTPEQVLDAPLRIRTGMKSVSAVRIMGVVPDFALDQTRGPIKPQIFFVDPNCSYGMNVKIVAGRQAETRRAIGRLWKELGPPRPLQSRFIDDFLKTVVYAGVIRQGIALGVLAAVALLLGTLGMFALASFTTERRTKEIGVRKALGASTPDILGLLLWSFTRPVLWANLVAWPIAWWAMDRWLQGFAARITLSPWFFLAAAGAALAIALSTVASHALHVARAQPARALRYE